ncbi:unnamed protein product, partial [Prorocentrum cordatum]
APLAAPGQPRALAAHPACVPAAASACAPPAGAAWPRAALEAHARRPDNQECADCGARAPEWASVNQGVTLCIVCAGVHRSLGAHVSKVSPPRLDSWKPDEVQQFLSGGGNAEVGRRLCSRGAAQRLAPGAPREQTGSSRRSMRRPPPCRRAGRERRLAGRRRRAWGRRATRAWSSWRCGASSWRAAG